MPLPPGPSREAHEITSDLEADFYELLGVIGPAFNRRPTPGMLEALDGFCKKLADELSGVESHVVAEVVEQLRKLGMGRLRTHQDSLILYGQISLRLAMIYQQRAQGASHDVDVAPVEEAEVIELVARQAGGAAVRLVQGGE